jgi:CheY-like chemotaxis protein
MVASQKKARETTIASKGRILLVDDEQDIMMIFKMALQRSGWAVKEFTDPTLALEHFERHSKDYDAILSDIRMPSMNGFEFVRRIKAKKPDVKIFIMTAMEISRSELEKVLPSVKIDGLIQKPVSTHMLVSLIEKGTTPKKRSYHGFEADDDNLPALGYG